MLGKLMKYEFMAMGRIFLPLFGALIIVSIVNGLLSLGEFSVPQGIGIVVSVLLIIGIFVIVYILTIQRFWTNLLSSEGYLMNTLPVSTDKLILSKLFVATVWSIVSVLVVLGAIFIMAGNSADFISMIEDLRSAQQAYIYFGTGEIILIVIQLIAIIILGTFCNTLLIYAWMSLGMLFNKYRALASFGAFVLITTALQIITTIIITVATFTGTFRSIDIWFDSVTTFSAIQAIIWASIAIIAVLGAIFYLITRYMLKNRLNLQ